MMTKERVELLFILFFAYLRTVREKRLKAIAEKLKDTASPVAENVIEKAKLAIPLSTK